jgi:hypothetical protein
MSMIKILLVLICLITPLALFSQPISPIDSLKRRIDNLDNTSQQFSKKNDSLIIANNNLIKEVDYNEKLLNRYDILNNVVFVSMGVMLAIFGIAAPLIGYFFVFKPSTEQIKETQKLLDDTKNNMDRLFYDYTIKNRDNLIDNTLTQLENNLTDYRMRARTRYLETFYIEGFNDKQVLRIIKLHKKQHQGVVEFKRLLLFKENTFSTDFFLNEIKNDLNTFGSILYAIDYEKDEFLDYVAKNLNSSVGNLNDRIKRLKETSPNYLTKIYNNDEFVNGIDNAKLISLMESEDSLSETLQEKTNRQNSKAYKKYLVVKPI